MKQRLKRVLIQTEQGKRARVIYAYIVMLESGARKNPSIETVRPLANALGVAVAELLE